MNNTLAKLMGHLRQAGRKAIEAASAHEDETACGLTAFELEARVLYSATPVDFVDVQPEAVDVNEMLGEAPQLAAMSATLPQYDFLISTFGNGSGDGDTWQAGEIENFGGDDLDLSATGTDGEFSAFFDLSSFNTNNVRLRDAHDVLHDITLGSGANAFDLKAGDIIFNVDGGGTLTGTTTSIMANLDVYVFRPDVAGNYGAGDFFYLIDNPMPSAFSGLTLIDKPGGITMPDGAFFAEGTILGVADVFGIQAISTFVPNSVGQGVTGGAAGIYQFTGNFDIQEYVSGLHIVQDDMSIGDFDFLAGDILFSLEANEDVGNNDQRINAQDVGLLRYDGSGWNATRLFDGSDVGLSGGAERIDAITIGMAVDTNTAPAGITLDNNSIDENTDTSGGVAIGNLSATDAEGGPFTFEVVGPSPFSVSGNQLILTGETLDFEANATYPVALRVTDSGGLPFETTLNVFVNDVNEAPEVTLTNLVSSIPENTTVQTKIADIVITDDALGNEILEVQGADRNYFEIIGNELFLKANQPLNFDSRPTLDVTVEINDPTISGNAVEDQDSHTVNVTDINSAPAVALINRVSMLPEDFDTTTRVKVADIQITDDATGTETLAVSGPDVLDFEIVGTELFLRAGTMLDFESKPGFDVTIEVDDPGLGSTFEDTVDYSLAIGDVNEAPTVLIQNAIGSVNEGTLGSNLKVADIVVIDDALGSETLILSGFDSSYFEIIGTELFLKAGEVIDFETNPLLDVTVAVDDPTLGTTFEDSASHSINVVDGNDAPTVQLINVVNEVDENSTAQLKVADVVVMDDALGSQTLGLSGIDANFFEIIGNELFLKAGQNIDFETNPVLDVSVVVDDATLGTSFDDSANHAVNVQDVNEAPTIQLVNLLPDIDENTTVQTKVANIVVTDDALGSETLSLTGFDASFYEIIGTELFIKAGQTIDFESESYLNAIISVDDPTLGTGVEDSQSFSVAINDLDDDLSVALINTLPSLPEDHDTSTRTKVADIVVANDPSGSANLTVTGSDANMFEIDGTELYLKAGVALDFETRNHFDIVVEVDDPALGTTFEDQATHVLGVDDVNEAPSVSLKNVIPSIPENTSVQTKVADIEITDDALGTETLSLDGAHKDLFEIVGNELYLKAGQGIDFETTGILAVTIKIDDPTLGFSNDDADNINIVVTDVNEAPSVALANQITSLPEDHDTSSPTRIADIVISDDGMGSENLFLSGADSNVFEIIGSSLYLKAGVALDFESQDVLDVAVEVDDTTLGSGSEDVTSQTLVITDVNEAPSVALVNTVDSLPENYDTTVAVKIADIVITDDALGTESLVLSGSNSDAFEIVGAELYLKANTVLDFESLSSLDVTVSVDDATLGTGVEDSVPHSLTVRDENEAPTIQLVNTLTSLPEDTLVRTKVADIVISDDALGTETLSLTGAHANLFEIDGTELYLVANSGLDFETEPQLDVTVVIDDPAIGSGPEDNDGQIIAVTDINEAPHVDNPAGTIDAVEDDPDMVVDLTGVFGDVDGDSLTLSIGEISDPNTVSASIVGNELTIDFLDDQFGGPLTIDIVATDGEYESTDTITINVEAENDAPRADDLALSTIYRDSDPTGDLIQDIVDAVFFDIDGDSLLGIAIVTNDATAAEGIWQVKGSSNEWRDIGAVDVNLAKVVPAGSSIRFLPAPGFVGIPTPIEFVVIDSSYSGPANGTIDVANSGSTTPFSADSFEIGIEVKQFGIEVTPTSPMITNEAGQDATFEVVLLSEPTGNVVIPIESADNSEGRPSTNQLTFTPANWSVPQTVTITGVDEFVDDGDQNYEVEFGPVQSSDLQYSNYSIDELQYVNLDDDVAAVVVSETSLQTNENGETDQFDVQLGSQPISNVTVDLHVSDESEALLSSSVVEFTPSNWNVPQTITVTGQNDQVADGDTPFVITATPSSGDSNFASLSPVDIDAENVAAIGPTDGPTENVVAPPVDETNDNSDLEFVGPATNATPDAEESGVDDVEKKPRTFVVVDSREPLKEATEDRFEASQYWRRVETSDNGIQFYSNRAAIVEEFVSEMGFNEKEELSHLWSGLDDLDERINEESDAPMLAVGAAASIASVFTAGYLVWLVRGGWVLAGLLSQRAMWNSFNVLAVLNKPDDEDEDSKSLESLVNDPQTEQRSPTVDTTNIAELTQVSV